MLTRLYVHNYRCLVNFEFKPQQVQLLLGANGSGKTTVMDVIDGLRRVAIEGVRLDQPAPTFGAGTKTRWLTEKSQRFEIDVDGNGGTYSYRLTIDEIGAAQVPRVQREELLFDAKPLFRFIEGAIELFSDHQNVQPGAEFNSDWHRSGLSVVSPNVHNKKLTWFKQWLNNCWCFQINPWAILSRSDAESKHPNRYLSNLADWFRHLAQESPSSVAETVGELRKIIPGLKDLVATEAGMDVRVIQARLTTPDAHTHAMALGELSEGQRALIGLFLIGCNRASDSTLFIDEPENFLALAEIQPWLLWIQDQVLDAGGQLLLSSHHPELINQLARNAVILDRSDGTHAQLKPFPPDTAGLEPAELLARGWENA